MHSAKTGKTATQRPADDWRKAVTAEDLAFDRDHIWHPYTSVVRPSPVVPVASAQGVRLRLESGAELIDGMSSWWAAIHGYNHPVLNAAIKGQLEAMSHVMFGGLTHKPAIGLCQRLVAMTPPPLDTVFLADSGSVAVEVAVKIALQYWQAQGQPGRQRLMTVRGGYHGDTMGAMALCDPEQGMHSLFRSVLPAHIFAPRPDCRFDSPEAGQAIEAFEALLRQHHHQLAAVILEPIVQGAGGMRFYSPHYLRRLASLCREYDVLLILDEIATGFGRTGTLFACEHADVVPDIMTVGKALTGGCMSLAATLCTGTVSQGLSDQYPLMHGPTFMGNPLACATACASLDLLTQGDWKAQVARLESGLRAGLAPCAAMAAVADVRVLGAIGVVELKKPVDMHSLQPRLVAEGVWVRPFGRLIYLMPAFVMGDEDLVQLCSGVRRVVQELSDA